MSTRRRALLGAIAATVPLAGCAGFPETVEEDVSGDGDDDQGAPDDDSDEGIFEEVEELVTVGPDEEPEFDPDHLEVDPGTVVGFEWETTGHSIAVRDQPEDADWQGVPNTQEAGHLHVHEFDAEGQYDYYCDPHEDQGMEGQLFVGDVELEDVQDDEADEDPEEEDADDPADADDPEDADDEGEPGDEDDPQAPEEGETDGDDDDPENEDESREDDAEEEEND